MSAAPLTGQVTTTGAAQPLTTQPASPTAWLLKAPVANTSTVYIGPIGVTAVTGYPLEPGDEITFDRRPVAGGIFDLSPGDLYVVGSGGVAAWFAFR